MAHLTMSWKYSSLRNGGWWKMCSAIFHVIFVSIVASKRFAERKYFSHFIEMDVANELDNQHNENVLSL